MNSIEYFLIIVVALIIIVGLFLDEINKYYDTIKQSIQVKKWEVDMSIKYRELIKYIMSGDSRSRIIQETPNSLTLGVSNADSATLFELIQTEKLTVIWKVNSPEFGEHNQIWHFSEYGDQEKMMAKIINDLESYQRCYLNMVLSKRVDELNYNK